MVMVVWFLSGITLCWNECISWSWNRQLERFYWKSKCFPMKTRKTSMSSERFAMVANLHNSMKVLKFQKQTIYLHLIRRFETVVLLSICQYIEQCVLAVPTLRRVVPSQNKTTHQWCIANTGATEWQPRPILAISGRSANLPKAQHGECTGCPKSHWGGFNSLITSLILQLYAWHFDTL